ncbi:hypothetical protein OH807_33315 [Kitasatospora sp. NBC_01560]|uniref:hypothetical protein n=1 Tax=Kitasatospora sp. NBC_01560 TaxID=2975965 RepID=UPI003865E51C
MDRRGGRALRGVSGLLGIAAVLSLLGGCSAPYRRITGILVANGEAIVLLRSCDRAAFDFITVSESSTHSSLQLTPPPGTNRAGAFPLHRPPAAWTADGTPPPPLDTTGASFSVDVRTDEPAESSVEFTTADLALLGPGQVWADQQVWALADFERHVRDRC